MPAQTVTPMKTAAMIPPSAPLERPDTDAPSKQTTSVNVYINLFQNFITLCTTAANRC